MKKVLCYLGILVLLFLSFLPPMLRILIKDTEDDTKEVLKSRTILSCSNDKFISNTSYENDKIQMIIIKKFKTLENDLDKENEEENNSIDTSISETEFSKIFEDLKTKSNVVYENLEDGEVITIDFSISNNENLNILNLKKEINSQKEYYESQNLTCFIRK